MRNKNPKRNDMSNLVRIFSDKPVGEKKKEQVELRVTSKQNVPSNKIVATNSGTESIIYNKNNKIINKPFKNLYNKILFSKKFDENNSSKHLNVTNLTRENSTKFGVNASAKIPFQKLKVTSNDVINLRKNNLVKRPLVTIIPKPVEKPISAKEIALINLIRSKKQQIKPIVKKQKSKKKKGVKVQAITIFDKLKKAKRKKAIRIKPVNRNKKITLLKSSDVFTDTDSNLRFELHSWKYKERRLTISASTKITETLVILLANHLLQEISQIVIGDMLPFKPLSESLSTQVIHALEKNLTVHKQDLNNISIIDFVMMKDKGLFAILEKYLLKNIPKSVFLVLNTSVKVKTKRRSNKKRKAFIKKRPTRKPRYKIKRIKEILKARKKVTKARAATLFIVLKRRNIFLNYSIIRKNKAVNKYGIRSKKPHYRVSYTASMGHLKIYKGRARATTVAVKALSNLFHK